MKRKHLFIGIAFVAVAASVLIVACSKNSSMTGTPSGGSGTQNVSLYMTDGPGEYDHVYLDIKSISVLVDTSSNTRAHDGWNWIGLGARNGNPGSWYVWDTLSAKEETSDLLQLRNGVDTLLATANIAAGSVRLIRIDLGTNNSVVRDSVTYPLHLPAGAPSYILVELKGNEWQRYAANSFRLWIDFDVMRSIVFYNNTYYLVPYIRPFILNMTGSITGRVLPLNAWPEAVSIYGSTDTAYALPDRSGSFKVIGLDDGTYSVHITAAGGYHDTTINAVTIANAGKVSVGTITLHK